MTANATGDSNAATEKSLHNQVIAAAGWLGGWAFACAAIFGLRFGKIWNLVGGTWLGLLIAYLVLFFGGALIFITFTKLDRIQSVTANVSQIRLVHETDSETFLA
jgi:hypothetical protein